MSKTKATDTAEREITELDEKIANTDEQVRAMRAELAEDAAAPLSWDEITCSRVEEVGRRGQRLSVVPRLSRGGEIKLAELRIRRHELDTAAPEAAGT